MNTLQSDVIDITAGLLVCAAGMVAFVISVFRVKNWDFTLLNFGLFAFFFGLLTSVLVIPLSAFLVNIFGRGLYSSMVWVFRSTIVYAIGAIAYDLV